MEGEVECFSISRQVSVARPWLVLSPWPPAQVGIRSAWLRCKAHSKASSRAGLAVKGTLEHSGISGQVGCKAPVRL